MSTSTDGDSRPDGRGRGPSRTRREQELTTEQWLRKRAAALRDRAEKIRKEAENLVADAERLEATANELAGRLGGSEDGEHLATHQKRPHLRLREHRHTVGGEMITAEHGPAISKGKIQARLDAGEKVDALVLACAAKNLSLRGLAREAESKLKRGVPPSGISQARAGTRPIARDVADYIEKRTGFKATATNWPGGISE